MTSAETKWFRVAECGSIPAREGRAVEIASKQVAIFNLGKEFVAVENRCPHKSGPLADGILSGRTIVCPLHAWKFDLATGMPVNHQESGACLKSFPTRIENGVICVEVPIGEEMETEIPQACESTDRPLRWVARKPILPSNTPQLPQR
jgi:nitrite reductase (NADH) small subunit